MQLHRRGIISQGTKEPQRTQVITRNVRYDVMMYVSQNRLFIVLVVLYPLQDLFGRNVCGEECEGDGGGEAGDRGQEEEHALVSEQGGEVLGEEGSQRASSSRAGHHQPVVLGAVPRAVTLGVANNVIHFRFQTICIETSLCLSCGGGQQYEGGADAAVERPHPHGEQGAGQVRGEVE